MLRCMSRRSFPYWVALFTIAGAACESSSSPGGENNATSNDIDAGIDGGTRDPDASDNVNDQPDGDGGSDGSAAVPAIRYVGRFGGTASAPIAMWPASKLIVRFEGTELDATLDASGGGANATFFDVLVDGTPAAIPLELHDGTSAKTIASGLSPGVHTVELVKRTESNVGATQFVEFRYPNGGRLLPPPTFSGRRVEAVGTSSVMGYGIEGAGPSCPGGAPSITHNARKSVGALSATDFGADFVFIGASGKGAIVNNDANDALTLPVLFERTSPNATTLWNHASWQPDVWVLFPSNLDIPGVSDTALNDMYEQFVTRARVVYPSAHIFVVVSAMASDTFPTGAQVRTRLTAMSLEVARRRNALGDNKTYAYTMTRYEDAQIVGCFYHPNLALSRQMANELNGWISARLGW